jgi:hypothetical protein
VRAYEEERWTKGFMWNSVEMIEKDREEEELVS